MIKHNIPSTTARNLWEACFPADTEPFLDLYFSAVYKPEHTLCLEKSGTPIAHVQCLPYELQYGQKTWQAGYISGACTLPDYRGKGYMHSLMAAALRHMYERGDVLSMLIPADAWLYDFYRHKAGYETAFYDASTTDGHNLCATDEKLNAPDWQSLILAAQRARPQGSICHTRAQLEVVLKDYQLAGGGVAFWPSDGQQAITSACFYLPTTDHQLYIGAIYGSAASRKALIQELLSAYECHTFTARVEAQPSSGQPKGMLRILRAETFLQHIAAQRPHLTDSFILIDEQLPENNGLYALSEGTLMRRGAAANDRAEVLTPAMLVRRFLAEQTPDLRLMLE